MPFQKMKEGKKMIEFIKEFGITFLCFFIGYSVVECVTGKEKKDDQ